MATVNLGEVLVIAVAYLLGVVLLHRWPGLGLLHWGLLSLFHVAVVGIQSVVLVFHLNPWLPCLDSPVNRFLDALLVLGLES